MQYLDLAGWLLADLCSGFETNAIRWRGARITLPFASINDTKRDEPALVHVDRCNEVPLDGAADVVGMQDHWPATVMLERV